MVNAKKTSFTATQVANNSMAMGTAFMHILELEKKVLRLRHHVLVLSKRLNGKGKEEGIEEKEEMAEVVAEEVVEAKVAAGGGPPITSGVYKAVAEQEDVAEEIVAGVESRSVGSEDDQDEVVDGKIAVRLLGHRKRRIAEAGGEERVKVEEKSLVRAIPVSPRSVEREVARGRVPSGPASMFAGRGRGGMGRGFEFGLEGYGYRGRGRWRGGYYY